MFSREDEAKKGMNGVRQWRRTWRSALRSACLSVASDGVGCLCRVVFMPTCDTLGTKLKINWFLCEFLRERIETVHF